MKVRLFAGMTSLLLLVSPVVTGQEPEADPSELPRIPATEPKDVMDTFEVVPGYKLELVAHEPDVVDPIAMAFDETGAMFVVEMRGYSERRDESLGRIRKLVDSDGDGIFETSTVYVDGLQWPTGVTCFKGGVFVAATPDLFYFKDTDGDGKSDEKMHVFTGFGPPADQLRVNMQALFNSLQWGPDNRIWGATARNGGMVRRPEAPESAAVNLRGADFSFDPEKLDFRAENGTAQYGMSFDSNGNRYICSNSNHIIRVMWERPWTAVNPLYSLPSPLVSIADDGSAAPVYRISPDEPWRIVRTRWRVAGAVKGMVEGGGRVSGYFTSATGITIYRGDAMPNCRGFAFVGDVGSNLVHRKKISGSGVQPVASRVDKEKEFIASKDNWFRPANFANGPDGALYIADMYRETIEHPWSIPEGIKKHVDLNSGWDRGRIYRVSASRFKRPEIPNLAEKNDAELQTLSRNGSNAWERDTARRLLFERGYHPGNVTSNTPFRKALALARAKTSEEKSAQLVELAKKADDDKWMIAAVTHAVQIPDDAKAVFSAGGPELQLEVAELIGKMDWTEAPKWIASKIKADSHGIGVLARFASTAKSRAAEGNGAIIGLARAIVADPKSSGSRRTRAFSLLVSTGQISEAGLEKILTNSQIDSAFRLQAFDAFSAKNPTGLAGVLVENWSDMPPEIKSRAVPFLVFPKKDRAMILLEALQAGTIEKTEIPPDQAEKLRKHSSKQVAALANQLLPAPVVVSRADVVKKYEKALKLKGDPAKGKVVYQKACLTCHKSPDGEGFAVGPDFTTFKTAGPDSILKNLFDPNAEIAPQYQAYAFTLNNGEQYSAIIAEENQTDVTIRMLGGVEKTFPRKEVKSMKGLGISLMPEGLEATMTVEDVSDLLAYIAGE
ncbi:MAG: c-type cytochrome [Verrucomicrobiales bacterium]|nr:c-type cytochrome [Verrucomicrobiales bacterium]